MRSESNRADQEDGDDPHTPWYRHAPAVHTLILGGSAIALDINGRDDLVGCFLLKHIGAWESLRRIGMGLCAREDALGIMASGLEGSSVSCAGHANVFIDVLNPYVGPGSLHSSHGAPLGLGMAVVNTPLFGVSLSKSLH